MASNYDDVIKAVEALRGKISISPKLGVICGSGLGKLGTDVEDKVIVPYADIPGFPRTTVEGHDGNLIFGKLGGKPVVVMQGRFHQYEGFNKNQITFPIRVMKVLGVETLIITCASGGLNPKLKAGDFVTLNDHISPSSFTTDNVLVGPNEPRFGSRFVATSDAYCPKLIAQVHATAKTLGYEDRTHTGVYFHITGPTYASRAESRVQLSMGADVVGMSTVPEVIAASHCNMKVVAIALVSDMCAMPGDTREPVTHSLVLATVDRCAQDMRKLIVQFIKQI